MVQKRLKPEEIVTKLRQVDALLSQGRPVAEPARSISVTQISVETAVRTAIGTPWRAPTERGGHGHRRATLRILPLDSRRAKP